LGRRFDVDPLAFHQHFHHARLLDEASYGTNIMDQFSDVRLAVLVEQVLRRRSVQLGIEDRAFVSVFLFANDSEAEDSRESTGK